MYKRLVRLSTTLAFLAASFSFTPAALAQVCAYNSTQGTCACPTSGGGTTCFGGQQYRSTDSTCVADGRPCSGANMQYNCGTAACECNTASYPCGGCTAATSVPGTSCGGGTGIYANACGTCTVNPYVLISPSAQQPGNVNVAGTVTAGGDMYMSNTKAIRTDGAGITTLNVGNWGTGATGFVEKVFGTLDATQICISGTCMSSWPGGTGRGGAVPMYAGVNGTTGQSTFTDSWLRQSSLGNITLGVDPAFNGPASSNGGATATFGGSFLGTVGADPIVFTPPTWNSVDVGVMFWDKPTGAFRSGYSGTLNNWQKSELGIGSTAFGHGAEASGPYSFAAGGGYARGNDSISLGAAGVTGAGAIGIGNSTNATGAGSIAIGSSTSSGLNSLSLGGSSGNGASGAGAVSIGTGASAQGADSIVIGRGSVTAAGIGSVLINSNQASALSNIYPGTVMLSAGSNTPAMFIKAAPAVATPSNIGIGTVLPTSRLHISQVAGTEGLRVISSNFSPLVIRNTADTADLMRLDQLGNLTIAGTFAVPGMISGTGTANYVPKFTAASTVGNSPILIDPTTSNIAIGTTNVNFPFNLYGNVASNPVAYIRNLGAGGALYLSATPGVGQSALTILNIPSDPSASGIDITGGSGVGLIARGSAAAIRAYDEVQISAGGRALSVTTTAGNPTAAFTNATYGQVMYMTGVSNSQTIPLLTLQSTATAGTEVEGVSLAANGVERTRFYSNAVGDTVLATMSGTSKDILFRAGDDTTTDMLIDGATGNVGIGGAPGALYKMTIYPPSGAPALNLSSDYTWTSLFNNTNANGDAIFATGVGRAIRASTYGAGASSISGSCDGTNCRGVYGSTNATNYGYGVFGDSPSTAGGIGVFGNTMLGSAGYFQTNAIPTVDNPNATVRINRSNSTSGSLNMTGPVLLVEDTSNFYAKMGDLLQVKTPGGTVMVINNVGKVGVGTTAPVSQFTVSKSTAGGEGGVMTIQNTANAANSSVSLYLAPNNGGGNDLQRAASIKSRQAPIGNNADLGFFTAASDDPLERMTITRSGDVGIGTTAPAYTFDVNGTTRVASSLYADGGIHGNGMYGTYMYGDYINSKLSGDPLELQWGFPGDVVISGTDSNLQVQGTGTSTFSGNVSAESNTWGTGSGWILCNQNASCSCPSGSFMYAIYNYFLTYGYGYIACAKL